MEFTEQDFLLLCGNSTSDGSSTSAVWQVSDRVTGQVTAAFMLLILVVGLPWNLLVVLTIVKEKLYHQPTIVLLLNLVINDCIILIFILPLEMIIGFRGEFIFGKNDRDRCYSCRLGLVNTIFLLMSVYTITLMAFDRFLFIYKPFLYNRIMSSWRVAVVLAILWITVITLSTIGYKYIVFKPSLLSCLLAFSIRSKEVYYPILVYAAFCVPVLCLVIFNIWVVVIVQRNIRAIYNIRKLKDTTKSQDIANSMRKKCHQKELHLIRVFGGLLCSNLVTWLPVLLVILYVLISHQSAMDTIPAQVTSRILFFFQYVLHPMLETALLRDVREPMKKIIFLFCFWRKGDEISLSSDPEQKRCVSDCCRGDGELCKCCGCGFFELLQSALLLGNITHNRHRSNSTRHQPTSVTAANVTAANDIGHTSL